MDMMKQDRHPLVETLRLWLQQRVFDQDCGVGVAEELSLGGFNKSLADALCREIHTERLKLLHAGINVKRPPDDGTDFMLGFSEKEETQEKSQ
jgi:hypothetical protein